MYICVVIYTRMIHTTNVNTYLCMCVGLQKTVKQKENKKK